MNGLALLVHECFAMCHSFPNVVMLNLNSDIMKKEELQSRRSFFKTAAQRVLPIVGVMAFGPSLLMSCGDDDDDDDSGSSRGSSSGCKKCKTVCTAKCSSTCKMTAVTNASICGGNCKGYCYSTCKSLCYRTNKNYE